MKRRSRSSAEHSVVPPALGEPPVTPTSPVLRRAAASSAPAVNPAPSQAPHIHNSTDLCSLGSK